MQRISAVVSNFVVDPALMVQFAVALNGEDGHNWIELSRRPQSGLVLFQLVPVERFGLDLQFGGQGGYCLVKTVLI